jgi:stage V sporulation protein G
MSKLTVTKVKIFRKRNSKDKNFLGTTSFVLNNSFVVYGARLYERDGNRYVLMPTRKYKGKYLDICHPMTNELRDDIEKKVFKAYDNLKEGSRG